MIRDRLRALLLPVLLGCGIGVTYVIGRDAHRINWALVGWWVLTVLPIVAAVMALSLLVRERHLRRDAALRHHPAHRAIEQNVYDPIDTAESAYAELDRMYAEAERKFANPELPPLPIGWSTADVVAAFQALDAARRNGGTR